MSIEFLQQELTAFKKEFVRAALFAGSEIMRLDVENAQLKADTRQYRKDLRIRSYLTVIVVGITCIALPIFVGISTFILLMINNSFLKKLFCKIDNVTIRKVVSVSLKMSFATSAGLVTCGMLVPVFWITLKLRTAIKNKGESNGMV